MYLLGISSRPRQILGAGTVWDQRNLWRTEWIWDASWRGRERRDVGTWKEQGPGTSTRRTGYTAGRSAKRVEGWKARPWSWRVRHMEDPGVSKHRSPGLRRVFPQNLEKDHVPAGERSIMSFLLGTLTLTSQRKTLYCCWQHCLHSTHFFIQLWDFFSIAEKMNLNNFSFFSCFWNLAVCLWRRLPIYHSPCKICTMTLMPSTKSSVSKFPLFERVVSHTRAINALLLWRIQTWSRDSGRLLTSAGNLQW